MLREKLNPYRFLLVSRSPRRKQLLAGLDVSFEIIHSDVEEIWPKQLELQEIPKYLAELKANAFEKELNEKDILLTADTAVFFENEILNKPVDRNDAFNMLMKLSGKVHSVITGVCLMNKTRKTSFSDLTKVHFKKLHENEIDYYLDNYDPYDKAGSYGAQDWIGYIGIDRLEGSYYNVMGLPVRKVYSELLKFIEK